MVAVEVVVVTVEVVVVVVVVTGDGVGALDGKRLGDSEGTVEGVVVETDKNLSTFLWPTVLLMRLPQSDSACVRRVLNLDLRSVKRSSRFRRGTSSDVQPATNITESNNVICLVIFVPVRAGVESFKNSNLFSVTQNALAPRGPK